MPIVKEESKRYDDIATIESQPNLYKLTKVEAIDLDKRHTLQEMKAFHTEAEEAFQKMNSLIDWKNKYW